MAGETHLLLSAIGTYSDPTLAQESWAVNIRLALVFGNIDDVATLPSWVPSPVSINRTETNWTITGNWNVNQSAATFNPDDYLNDQAAPAFTAWQLGANRISSTCVLTQLKLSPIVGPSGHLIPAPPYAQGSPCVLTYNTGQPGGSTSAIMPLQNALVVSHGSSQVGRHGRGRLFRPGLNYTNAITGTGYLQTAAASDFVALQKTLLEALTYSPVSTGAPHVHAIITGKPFAQYAKISKVRVGNVIDTQRRRRRSLPETFVNDTVAP